jgi:hypothetical protein
VPLTATSALWYRCLIQLQQRHACRASIFRESLAIQERRSLRQGEAMPRTDGFFKSNGFPSTMNIVLRGSGHRYATWRLTAPEGIFGKLPHIRVIYLKKWNGRTTVDSEVFMSLLGLYATKRELRETVGQALRYEETSIAGPEYQSNGTVVVAGPHRDNLKWEAEVTLKDGTILKVRWDLTHERTGIDGILPHGVSGSRRSVRVYLRLESRFFTKEVNCMPSALQIALSSITSIRGSPRSYLLAKVCKTLVRQFDLLPHLNHCSPYWVEIAYFLGSLDILRITVGVSSSR